MDNYAGKQSFVRTGLLASAQYRDEPTDTADVGRMQQLIGRVSNMAQHMNEIGHRLRDHADTLHGTVPEQAAANGPHPARPGLFGMLEDALDSVDRAHSYVAEQAARNCGLA